MTLQCISKTETTNAVQVVFQQMDQAGKPNTQITLVSSDVKEVGWFKPGLMYNITIADVV